MKRTLIIVILMQCALSLAAQKVWVQVTKANIAEASWQVLDEQFNPVFAGNEYPVSDSIPFSLESEKRYLFEVSVDKINVPDTILCRLYVNGEPVLLVRTDIGTGDHFYYFFTGVRQEAAKITGGVGTDISSFPWQIYLEAGNYACGGSIIGSSWILTAAHCTEDDFGNLIPASQMNVTVGTNIPSTGGGKNYSVIQVIRNESYNSQTLENDIALLKLAGSISYTNATPIDLISITDAEAGYTDPGVFSWVTGYGLTRVSPPAYPTTLQKVQLPLISNTQASVVWKDIPSTDLMAGYLNGGKDACAGDSGGPLVVPYQGGFKQAGIVSWGSPNCDTYGAYTRVSLFEDWITSKTGIEISFRAPVPDGDSIVCHGTASNTYTISQPPAGVTSYEWQLLPAEAGTISANSAQATVTWNQSFLGVAKLMVRLFRSSTDFTDWRTKFIHVVTSTGILSQSSDTAVCEAQPVSLKINPAGYNLTYSWFRNDTLVDVGSSNQISFQQAAVRNSAVYKCRLTGFCGSVLSDPMSLTVYPLTRINDITPDQSVSFGGSLSLDVSAKGHDLTYQWQKDSVAVAAGNGPALELQNVNATATGQYKVMVTGTCGIVSSSKVYVYVRKKDFVADPELYVWPTRTSTSVSVAMSQAETYNVRLFSTTGRLVWEKSGCQYLTTIDFSHLAKGLYILTVSSSNLKETVKIIRY